MVMERGRNVEHGAGGGAGGRATERVLDGTEDEGREREKAKR